MAVTQEPIVGIIVVLEGNSHDFITLRHEQKKGGISVAIYSLINADGYDGFFFTGKFLSYSHYHYTHPLCNLANQVTIDLPSIRVMISIRAEHPTLAVSHGRLG